MAQLTPTTNRFIAYFDIMGFKDLIYRSTHEEVSYTMDEVCSIAGAIKQSERKDFERLSTTDAQNHEKSIVVPAVFSDSILFVTESDTPSDVHKIIFASSFFLCRLMRKNIPVKGALAHGKFTADFRKSCFFGQPLVDAYLLAEQTHFYGATFHNSIEKHFYTSNHIIPPDFIRKKRFL